MRNIILILINFLGFLGGNQDGVVAWFTQGHTVNLWYRRNVNPDARCHMVAHEEFIIYKRKKAHIQLTLYQHGKSNYGSVGSQKRM